MAEQLRGHHPDTASSDLPSFDTYGSEHSRTLFINLQVIADQPQPPIYLQSARTMAGDRRPTARKRGNRSRQAVRRAIAPAVNSLVQSVTGSVFSEHHNS